MIRRLMVILCFILLYVVPASADLTVDLPEKAMNGRAFFVTVMADSDSPVILEWNKQRVDVTCTRDGDKFVGLALLPLPRDYAKKSVQVTAIEKADDGINTVVKTIPVSLKKYREQHLTVKKKYVDLSKKSLDRFYKDKAEIKAMMGSVSKARMWDKGFLRPVSGGMSSEFGVQRFFNEKPRKPHSGVDLRGKTGTPIKACSDGVVRIANDHFFSGKSVYIDHGQGIVSMYFHMSKMLVKKGETVKKGQIIGKVGATGRVTGPHLHFGLNISGVAVDPMPLFVQGK